MQLFDLVVDRFLGFFIQGQFLQTGLKFLDLGGFPLFFQPQFLLDCLELLPQEEFPLLGGNFFFDTLGDLGLQTGNFQFFFQ